jgi:hypothetical protein
LIYEHPGRPDEVSHIEFSCVGCYHFVHTGGAIITDILERPLNELVTSEEEFLRSAATAHGLWFWRSGAADSVRMLESEGYRGWRIESAVGFSGFVVAKNVLQKQDA